MKKRLITILLLIVVLLFTACGNKVQSGELVNNGSFESETGTKVSEWALERYDVAPPVEYYQVVQDDSAPDGSNVIKIIFVGISAMGQL
jgi:outer membrane lipopolysaccharide assembly protein LptE/RlpB